MPNDNTNKLIVQLDIPTTAFNKIIDLFEDGIQKGIVDRFYILTKNGVPVIHKDQSDPNQYLSHETRLGSAIAAIQRDEILYRALSDTDPITGIEYGDLS